MKEMSSTLLALIFAVLSMFLLMLADRNSGESPGRLRSDQASVSGAGLRFALHRSIQRDRD